jgi:hypothetical protein
MVSSTDLRCTALGMKLGICGERQVMNCLSYDTAPGSLSVPTNIPTLYIDTGIQGLLQSLQENGR